MLGPILLVALLCAIASASNSSNALSDIDSHPLTYASDIALPLTTRGRWIVDQRGSRVKFACINWASHMEALVPEGLADQPMDELVKTIRHLGFNCVRFTMSTEMTENFTVPIRVSIDRAMSTETKGGFYRNNHEFAGDDVTVYDVFNAAMKAMKRHDLLVVLDNHVSEASWCCGYTDRNRWWDSFDARRLFNLQRSSSAEAETELSGNSDNDLFPVDPWLAGLSHIATEASKWPHVVGVGLRNEVHNFNPFGRTQRWFKNMRLAGYTVHKVDPSLLIVVGGLSFASYLRHLKSEPLFHPDSAIKQQLVYEAHFYNLLYVSPGWKLFGYKATCKYMNAFLNTRVGFVTQTGRDFSGPLWLSEFGFNVEEYRPNDERNPDTMWMRCLRQWMEERDIDWAYWVLHGKYYKREHAQDFFEEWGLLNEFHSKVRNPYILDTLRSLMTIRQGI